MNTLLDEARQLQTELTALRRKLHQYPELACEEYRTADEIETFLDQLNIPHHRVGETGVCGILRGNNPGSHTIALRADIDALPIQELNQVPYCSQRDGIMHACGHDAHTACLLVAAQLLAAHRNDFSGEVRLCFQPGEEVGKGALDFVQSGELDGVERVFGLHTAHEIPSGTVSLTAELNNAAVDQFRILVHGQCAHVSTPELGADALYIASHIVTAIQALITRQFSPVEPVLIGVGKFHSGTTYNAVAGEAELEGTTRTVRNETRMEVRRKLTELVNQIASAYGATAEILWTGICSALYNDEAVCHEATQAAELQLPGVTISHDRPYSLGGDNFSEFNLAVPGAYAYLGTGNDALPGTLNAAHNGNFDIDEATLPIGAALYAAYTLWWLNQ